VARQPRPRVVTGLDGELTELLRDMRHQAGLTQSQLGKLLGWWLADDGTCGIVSRYEAGRRVPKAELVGRWAAACGFHAELVVTRPGAGRWTVPLNDGPQP
jgi:transcriptional regulator with XRE-family HTH domain